MKKVLRTALSLVTALALAAFPAYAETSYGNADWHVAFTQEREMDSNFRTADLDDVIMGLQPGDDVLISLALRNENEHITDWYMTNEVLYSLEDRSTNSATGGGAYTYRLAYTDRNGEETVLYDSDTVGGEDQTGGEGLHEATDSLKDFFYLDTLETGESGTVTLEVALDGETQGNDYQDTLADLQMNFAVELDETNQNRNNRNENNDNNDNDQVGNNRSRNRRTTTVQTSDESQMLLYSAIMAGSGLLLLILAIYSWRRSRKGGGAK